MRLNEKVAVVVGGGSGIGEAIAHLFAREGAAVAIADINRESAAKVSESIRAERPNARPYGLDVVDRAQVAEVFAAVARDFGNIDILINAVGISQFKAIEEISAEDVRRTVEVNLIGVIFACQEAGRYMIPRHRG